MGLKADVAKNNMVTTGGNIAAAALSFVFNIMLARLLPPEQFGLFSFALVVLSFFMVFVDPGLGNTMIKFVSGFVDRGEWDKTKSLVSIFMKVRLILYVAVAAVMVLFSGQISVLIFNKPESGLFVTLAAGLLLANFAFDFTSSVLTGLRRFGSITVMRITERVLRITLVAAFLLMGLGVLGAIWGVLASFLLAGVLGVIILLGSKRLIGAKHVAVEKRPLLSFSFWSLLGTIIYGVYMVTDQIMVSALRPVQDIGFYSIAALWSALITYLVPVNAIVMYTYFSVHDKEKAFLAFKKSLKYSVAAALPLAFMMSAFSKAVIGIFYKPDFLPAANALGVLSLASVPLLAGMLLMTYMYGMGRPKMHTAVMSCVLVLSISLNFILISNYGILGASIASLASRCVESAVLLTAVVMVSGNISWKDIMKPLFASVIIYSIALLLPVSGIVALLAAGAALAALYAAIMLGIGGIGMSEVKTALGWVRSALRLGP